MKYWMLAFVVVLAACAAPPATSPAAERPVAATRCEDTTVTGTRLRGCNTSGSVRTIGSATAHDDALRVQSISNITGARGN